MAPLVAALRRTGPPGEEAFWQLFDRCGEANQVRLLKYAQLAAAAPDSRPTPRFQEACRRLLSQPLDDGRLLPAVAVHVAADSDLAGLARQALRQALPRFPAGAPQRLQCVKILERLKDPAAATWRLKLADRRGPASERYQAVVELRRVKSRAALTLALGLANSEFEAYMTRYFALGVVKQREPALARKIATRWTRDHRYYLRSLGRTRLAGEPDGGL
jgi:hypothetical protein